MGFNKKKSNRIIERFKTHNEVLFREQFKALQNNKTLISVSQQGLAEVAQVLNDDDRQTH